MNWYPKVSADISQLPQAIIYYEQELLNAKTECIIQGNIEKIAAAMPGTVEYRYNQLQEIEAILELLNIELRKLKSFYFRKYLESYQKILTQKECDKYVDGEVEVANFEMVVNDFALIRNKWLGITKALEQKQWQLSNIVRLRVAGMEDASI